MSALSGKAAVIAGQFDSRDTANAAHQYFTSITPMGRLGRPEEIAAVVPSIASNEGD